MVVREKFNEELKELQNKLIELGEFSVNALGKSLEALETGDVDLALEVMENDTEANRMEDDINDFAYFIIAKQQPVAVDLRRVIVAIKIAADIERIADFAANTAKTAIRIGEVALLKPIEQIREMHTITSSMLKISLEAFNKEDVLMAKKVTKMDDDVDHLYKQTIKALLEINQKNPDYSTQVSQLIFVCRYLERAADHVTNIGENVFYLVKGRRYEINN